jgi:hypothetical protein
MELARAGEFVNELPNDSSKKRGCSLNVRRGAFGGVSKASRFTLLVPTRSCPVGRANRCREVSRDALLTGEGKAGTLYLRRRREALNADTFPGTDLASAVRGNLKTVGMISSENSLGILEGAPPRSDKSRMLREVSKGNSLGGVSLCLFSLKRILT